MKNDNVLEVAGLSVAFGGNKVVDNISYSLRRGCTLGIVGESGSGKSVSSLALMGLLPSNAAVGGSATFFPGEGRPINLLDLDEQGFRNIRGGHISMIFQEPMTSLNPMQRCGAQVIEMMRAHGEHNLDAARRRTLDLFNEVQLPRPESIFSSYPHEISGGQKQRVMIAMALACNPDILIADEPTTALDVTVQHAILQLLKQLQQRHRISIIFITHDLGVVNQIADDIAVMYRGHIVEYGTADQVLHHPSQPYTQGLLACRPPLDSRPLRLPTVQEFLDGTYSAGGDRQPEPLPDPATPIISVRNLDVTYTLKKNIFGKPLQTLKAVDGLSFDIFEGETLGLVGESGCGKSTLGRAILRLIDHSDGTIAYRGTPLDRLDAHHMRTLRTKLQIIFQDPYSSLNPRITVGDAIAEPLVVHNPSHLDRTALHDRVLQLMQQVGLQPEWYHRYPHEFSGGQRQRICIARALILNPELVICDESVSALDVSVQAQVLNLLNDLKRHYHFTYLFITHDLGVVKYLSDRIMVMQHGRIVESGTPDQIFSNPQTDYTRTLINAIPRL